MNSAFLEENLRQVQERIRATCERVGRNPSEVTLVAVSKTKPTEAIQKCHQLGALDFGENYVQEALGKQKELSSLALRWHFIGHLQKNKVKFVVGQFYLIQSVDSFALAEKIAQKAAELGLLQRVLLEVNLGDESTKGGFTESGLLEQFDRLRQLSHLELAGLMALPPLHEDPELTRPYFKKLRTLFADLKERLPLPQQKLWQYLSMGTTGDYTVAIEEGANLVRVGTAIFGARERKLELQNDNESK